MGYDLFKRDCVRIYLLDEVVNQKSTSLSVYLESDGSDRNYLSLRKQGADSFQYNNFVVTEIQSENCIMFKPNVVGCPASISINTDKDFAIEVVRNGSTTVDCSFPLVAGEVKIEFSPEKYYTKYSLFIDQCSTTIKAEDLHQMAAISQRTLFELKEDDKKLLGEIATANTEIESVKSAVAEHNETIAGLAKEKVELEERVANLGNEITALENDRKNLTAEKEATIEKFDKIKAEYDKDYDVFKDEIEEIKRTYDIDAEILKLFEKGDVTPIEELIENARRDIEKIEEQIRVFVEAKARKTAEIEKELKLGKKE